MTRKHGRKSWRKSWRLFNQAIYIYLISCRIESSFRVELSNQASQFDSSAWVQLLNSTRHFFKSISTRLDTFRVVYSTRTQVLDLTWSVYLSSLSKELKTYAHIIVLYKALNILINVWSSVNLIDQFITFCSFWMIIDDIIMNELNDTKM